MGYKIFKNVIIVVAGMLFLTACAGKDAVGEDTTQSDAVDLSGEMQSESVTENITDSVVIETVEGYDGETEEAYLVTIDEKAADYDGDGILDEVYRMGHMGQTDWDYYVNLSSCGKLYLGSASVGIGTGSELITCDLNGDGVDELVFLTGHVGADNPGSSTAYVYAYKDGGYAEFPLEQKENGRDFVIERDLTRARISCEAVDFSHTIWGTLKDMDMGYGFMQGTTVEHKSPRFIKLTEYEGRTAICYSYVFGSDLSGTYSVSEYVTYTGGTAQAVMVPDERYGSFEEINTYMNELAAEQSNYDIQYEYELGDDKMLYDVHRYIAEAGVDFLYVLYWYDDRGYYDNSLYIYVDNVPYSEEECIAIVELADDIEERFNIGEVEVGNFYVNTIEKYARAKNNSDSGTYYLYDEETDTYDVFMECEDVILYNQYNGTYSYVLDTDKGTFFAINAALYATPENGGSGVKRWYRDLTGDGVDELIIQVTDSDGNDCIFVGDIYNMKSISPFYNIYQQKDDESEDICYVMVFFYEYGKEIYEAVNEFYRASGISKSISIPGAERECVRFEKKASYHCDITDDDRLKLIYITDECRCEIYFSFNDEGCVVDSVEVYAESE